MNGSTVERFASSSDSLAGGTTGCILTGGGLIRWDDVVFRAWMDYMSIWVFPNIGGKPPKWMVYFMENPYEQMDDLGVPLFLETPR